MDWFKNHVDTVMVISSVIASMIWMNAKFNEIEKDIAVIKTVLVMKQIMPNDLAKFKEVKEK